MAVSNKTFFLIYTYFKNVFVIVFFLAILLNIMYSHSLIDHQLIFLFVPILMVIFLFEYLHKPAFLEISDTKIKYYIPDRRYLFWLNRKRIKEIELDKNDILKHDITSNMLGGKLISLSIVRGDKLILKLPKIGIGSSEKYTSIIARINNP